MKPLILDSTMTSMGGVFYPTGHVFALFHDEDGVRQAADTMRAAGYSSETAYASPEVIMQEIVHTLGSADAPLPSVGAEGDMVRRISDLAGSGHHGMLVKISDKHDVDRLVSLITPAGAVTAFYYRTFIIEDLITPPTDDPMQSVVVGTHAAAH